MTVLRRVLRIVPWAVLALALVAWSSAARAQCGTRWVTQAGNDTANDCLSSATRSAAASRAIRARERAWSLAERAH